MESKKQIKQVVPNSELPASIKEVEAGSPLDPFDPARLRRSQDFAESLGVKKKLTTIPVRKPSREWWVRVHPDESYKIETAVIDLKEDGEEKLYLVSPELWDGLATESTFGPWALFTAVNRQGVVFLWPVRLPGPDGKLDNWDRSALEVVNRGIQGWVQVVTDMSLGTYKTWETERNFSDPVWPEQSFHELLKIAFKNNYINDANHPVLKRLRGEI